VVKVKEKIMQTTMAVEDIKVTLPELLDSLTPGDEVILTRKQQPVARLILFVNGQQINLKENANAS
jgi:antitoxin (DNA-binding transcriptional repressor) of toxin-antitoxin stability system